MTQGRHRSRGDPRGSSPTGSAPGSGSVLLAVGLLGLALADAGGESPACPLPFEVEARGGHSLSVRCDLASSGTDSPVRGPARLLFGLPIDPNRADARTLEVLPGIGPRRAAAIVQARRDAPYRSVEDLTRVFGVGRRTVERLAPWMAIGERP